jgi:hypothetical protein
MAYISEIPIHQTPIHASCPSSGKKKQTRKQRKKEDFTFSADDEPSWRGDLSVCSGRMWSVRTLFRSDELGSARTNYSGMWNPRNKMHLFV